MANTCTPVPSSQSFCETRPDPRTLAEHLARLGFSLTFQQAATFYPSMNRCRPVTQPAQYHFSDGAGTEVIYLAGPDHAEDGETFPTHASRWWIYQGRDCGFYERLMWVLASRYGLSWTRDTLV